MMILGCSRINVAEQAQTPVPDGEMPVRLAVDGLQVGTKSYVSGAENHISSIQMLCFDAQGRYIAKRTADLQPSGDFAGQMTGHVPENTARIHFLANFNNLDLSGFGMGSQERQMMKSEALSSGITDEVRFWGFHSDDNMRNWLVSEDTVHLLRDRAKVTVVNTDEDIESVRWTIVGGLNRGYVAPTSATGAFPYTNDYVNGTMITEFRSSGVYGDDFTPETQGIWVSAGTGEGHEQFLFENSNSSTPVKLIVEATFKEGKYKTQAVRYHTLLLQDNDNVLYDVVRNAHFQLTIVNLPSDAVEGMGSGSFSEALTTENYSNNPYAQVEREINEISSNDYKLTVEKAVKIFHKSPDDYETVGSGDAAKYYGEVSFTYTALSSSASISSLTTDSFVAKWESPEVLGRVPMAKEETAPVVKSFDPSTGKGVIRFEMDKVTENLKYSAFQLTAKGSGLYRSVDLYSITQFTYGSTATLSDNNSTRTTGGEVREVYKLDFELDSTYPLSLYPATVRIYSSSLTPFSDQSAASAHGSFTVVVGKTNHLDSSATMMDWNYDAANWGTWYEYVIETPSSDNKYTIYLNDILANLSTKPSQVGLYFEVVHYGKPDPLTANTHIHETVTREFTRANFTWSGTTGTATNGATVSLGNSDDYRDYESQGWDYYYSDYALRIGRDNGNGTITVTAPTGYSIYGIQVSYFHRNQETTGGWYPSVIWEAKDFVGGSVTASPGTYSKSGLTGTWSGDPASSVTLTMSRDSENESPRITSIKVTYMKNE